MSNYVKRAPNYMSDFERKSLEIIELIIPAEATASYPIAYANYVGSKPSFLRSPKGGRLEIDIWIPGLPLAVEVQGEQHTKWNRSFFRSKSDWDYYRECDKIKEQVLATMKCPFLKIMWNEPLTVDFIAGKLRSLCSQYPAERVERLVSLLEDLGSRNG